MFQMNKYNKWYFSIIEKAKHNRTGEYFEKHHIIPKSLGGSNAKDNLVKLTAREHFIVHLLLIKMTNHPEHKKKMSYALHRMSYSKSKTHVRYIPNSRVFEICRKLISENQKLTKSMFGKKHSIETKQKIRLGNIGKIVSKESRDKNRNSHIGKVFSLEHKKNIGNATKNRPPNIYNDKAKKAFSIGQKERFKNPLERAKLEERLLKGRQSRLLSMKKISILEGGETKIFENIDEICKKYNVKNRNTYHLLTKYDGKCIPSGKFKGFIMSYIPYECH